ncbi:MAG: prepilin-type N-terminal cleavage/methylation domain-containing protein [Acholeplasmataceae bacterium]|jgi:prepilin-type N-terminal cleavage/methylation domain-containing protein|nr:prepilin-type N-terminal cleavage/methylation domain-containing protein [Acholeplasmataceae bacterium]
MRKHGLTIIELLGAIVLFGIIASISAMMIQTITKANARIVEQSRSNTEMTLLTAYLDQTYQSFGATNYEVCVNPTSCITLIKAFEYIPNLEAGTIQLVTYDPAETLVLQLLNNELLIDGQAYDISYFSIGSSSTLSYTISGDLLTFTIDLTLNGTYDDYLFHYEKTFILESIPLG